MMLDREEIEAKLVLNLCVMVFTQCCNDVVTALEEKPVDMAHFQEMPGLVGYIVQNGDNLWNIAKTYRTTMDSIRSLNHLEQDTLKRGDKLLLLKQTEGVL